MSIDDLKWFNYANTLYTLFTDTFTLFNYKLILFIQKFSYFEFILTNLVEFLVFSLLLSASLQKIHLKNKHEKKQTKNYFATGNHCL